ncbi:MAG TPA: FAD-dependent oxidoreductase [Sandaracinaceae bacterium LLY-WYZ-13_1]|nr:FAD-dependent oxidoreductase [Sandaracinaceae bacterium LLY-WYZ-13_1]
MADLETRTLIIGAGISGLSFADWIQGDDYVICEAGPEIGGYCKTIRQDGFVWDFSGHFFHFRHPEIESYLVGRMGDQKVLEVAKDARIHWKGELVDFPFQKNIHQLPREDFVDALYDLYFREDAEPTNFQEMLYAKFGRSIAEMFLVPYNEKLYATDLSALDVDAMGRFFPYADVDSIVRNFKRADNRSYNATFTYPEGGAIQYVRALMKGVDEAKLHLNERVERIDLATKTAHTSAGRTIAFESLVSSAPFPQLLEMTGIDHDTEAFTWNKVLVFNLGFDRKGPEGIHWIYFPQRELCFYRLGFYDNIFGTDRLSMYVEIGYPKDAVLDEAKVDEMRARVLDDLKACGVIDAHELVSWHSVVLDPAYVHITKRSQAEVARRKAALGTRGVYSVGRYGSWTYCSIEDNIVEARALAEAFDAAR